MSQKFLIDESLKTEFAEIAGSYFEFIDVRSCLSKSRIIQSSNFSDGLDALNFTPIGVVISSDNEELAIDVAMWFKALVPQKSDEFLDVVVYSPLAYNEIIRWFFLKFDQKTQVAALNGLSLSLELARLRALFERAQKSIVRLTNMSRQNDLVPPIAFQIPESNLSLPLSSSPMEMEIGVQLEAIHAIDVFFNKNHPLLSGEILFIELRGVVTNRVLQFWELRESSIARGWNRFYCDVQSDPLIERARVVITFKEGAANVELAAAATQFYTHYQSQSANQKSYPFAVRVLAGVVGTQLPRPGLMHACENQSTSDHADEDGAALLQLIMPLQPEAFAGQFCWRSDLRGFMLHPSGVHACIGVLENLQAVNVRRLTVRFRLDHPEAQATEFAFWAEPVNPTVIPVRSWARKLKTIAFKAGELSRIKIPAFAPGHEIVKSNIKNGVKWVPLYADQKGQIVFEFSSPYSGFLNLFFATRNGKNVNNYSWALFDDLDIEYSKK